MSTGQVRALQVQRNKQGAQRPAVVHKQNMPYSVAACGCRAGVEFACQEEKVWSGGRPGMQMRVPEGPGLRSEGLGPTE